MFFESLAAEPDSVAALDLEVADTSRVSFEGSDRGSLTLALPPHLSKELAATFLDAGDSERDPAGAAPVLSEMANMLCGAALGQYRPDGEFRLSSPRTHLGVAVASLPAPDGGWMRFPLDQGPVFVTLAPEAPA
jgi:hypothetical protein